ncbi:MAG: Archaeal Type pilin, N-terminal [Thermoplasmata archaeon]|nr:Archaeal Type pilin, N-terminal [Thermoplasmata archaeon]
MPRRGRPSRRDEHAVADTVGSILMVGITVVMATVLGGMLFAFKGPQNAPQSSVALAVSPGNAAWGNGDEQIRVTHNGGDPLATASTTVTYAINGVTQPPITGAAIGGSLYQGTTLLPARTSWDIGQTWIKTLTLQSTDTVAITVAAAANGGASLLAAAVLVPGQVAAGAACPFDTAAATVSQWVQSPGDVTKNTVGPVTVAATLVDNCAGVDASNAPHLWWRLRGVTTPSYADAGAMTTQGLSTWTGTIPAQTWLLQSGKILEYYIGPLKDVLGNTAAQSPLQQDTVDVDCTTDVSPPNVAAWTQTPSTLQSNSAASTVVVTATLADNCWGVDDTSAVPQLWFRLNDGSNPAYAQAGVMTQLPPSSNHQWQGTIPSQTWYLQSGRTLQYQLQNLKDQGGNAGSSAAQADLVDLVQPTYIATTGFTAVAGTLGNAVGATAAGGTEATLTEVPVTFAIQPGTTTTGSSSIAEASCASFANEACALASDDQFAVINAVTDVLDVNGVWGTPPAGAGGITQVLVGYEGRKSSTGTSPTLLLSYKVGGTAGPSTFSSAGLTSNTADNTVTLDVTGDRAWSTADIQALTVQLASTSMPSAFANIDQLFVKVSYAVAGGAGRGLNAQLAWSQVPAATPTVGSQAIDLGYHITPTSSNDVFVLQVWNPTAATWRTCAGQLTSTSGSAVAYTCLLANAAEYNNGAPLARVLDVSPASTTQTTLLLDYARINTT